MSLLPNLYFVNTGTKDSEKGWFPSNYVDVAQEQLYSRPDVSVDTMTSEPLDIVVTLYTFNSKATEELDFMKDERYDDTLNQLLQIV